MGADGADVGVRRRRKGSPHGVEPQSGLVPDSILDEYEILAALHRLEITKWMPLRSPFYIPIDPQSPTEGHK